MMARMEAGDSAPVIVGMFSLENKPNIMYAISMQKDISRKIGRVQFAEAFFVQEKKCSCTEKKYMILRGEWRGTKV
jgi:hypothetical protein